MFINFMKFNVYTIVDIFTELNFFLQKSMHCFRNIDLILRSYYLIALLW